MRVESLALDGVTDPSAYDPSLHGAEHAGLGNWWQDLVGSGMDLVQSRWGTQRGTVVQRMPDGTVVEIKQAEGLPVTGAPTSFGANIQAGPAAGIAAGTAVALGVGVLVLVLAMQRGGGGR